MERKSRKSGKRTESVQPEKKDSSMKCKKPFILSLAVVMFVLVPAMVTAAAADKPVIPTFSLAGGPDSRPDGQEDQTYQEEKISPVKFFDIGVGFGLVFLKDKDPFANLTTGGEKTSSVAPLYYYAQVGVQVPIPFKNKRGLFPLWIGAHEGVMGISATREIANCIDCDKVKMSFIGRTYFKPEIKIQVAREIFIGAAYSIFCRCSDFKNVITLFFSGNFSEVL